MPPPSYNGRVQTISMKGVDEGHKNKRMQRAKSKFLVPSSNSPIQICSCIGVLLNLLELSLSFGNQLPLKTTPFPRDLHRIFNNIIQTRAFGAVVQYFGSAVRNRPNRKRLKYQYSKQTDISVPTSLITHSVSIINTYFLITSSELFPVYCQNGTKSIKYNVRAKHRVCQW